MRRIRVKKHGVVSEATIDRIYTQSPGSLAILGYFAVTSVPPLVHVHY